MSYTGKHIASIAFAAVLAALCMGSMARADAGEEVLTVERCVGDGASVEPFGEAMVEGGILEEGILRAEVTQRVCDGIRERSSAGTPMQRLIAAQSYAQEVELVEGAMREGAMRGAADTANRHALPPTELISFASSQVPADEEYDDGGVPSVGGGAEEEQYDGGESPGAPVEGGGDAPLASDSAGQAAGMLDVARDGGDGSIAERWEEKKDAGIAAGASPFEAAAGARCGLELDLLDGTSARLYRGMFQINPAIPGEMRQGDTATVELSVSGATEEVYEELERSYEEAAEVSEVETGCVGLTRRMKAALIGQPNFEITANQGDDASIRSVVGDTVWSWDVTASSAGSHPLHLNLGHELKQSGEDATFNFVRPALFDETITVEATLRQRVVGFVGGNWQWLWTAILVPAAVFLWSKREKREDESDDAE